MAVIFLSRHDGVATFLCDLPTGAEHVEVRYLDFVWHEQKRFGGAFDALPTEAYEHHVFDAIGIVHCGGLPVGSEVVAAIDADLNIDRRPGGRVVGHVCTGYRDDQGRWHRLPEHAASADSLPPGSSKPGATPGRRAPGERLLTASRTR